MWTFTLLFTCAFLYVPVVMGKENIVFIMADDYGYNDIGYHGSEIHTPNLDRLAAAGVKLENYYVQPICSPTRSQLLSGRYQIHTGLQHAVIHPMQPNALPASMPTMADELKRLGYSTHMVGKWHIGFYKKEVTPTYRGFDSFFGLYAGAGDYYKHTKCLTYTFPNGTSNRRESAGPICGLDLHNGLKNVWNHRGHYSTGMFTERATNIIKTHAKEKPDKVPDKYTTPYSFIKDRKRRRYAGMVSAMDEAVGKIVSTLKSTGLMDSTTIIFSADNGGQVTSGGNNSPLRGWKESLWEGGIKGVGFVHSHFLHNTGQISRALVHVSDWFPTLVHLAGGNTTGMELDGHNQWSVISGGDNQLNIRNELLHNIDPLYPLHGENVFDNTWDTRVRAALRVGKWKIITGQPGYSSWVPAPNNGVPYPHYISIPEPRDKNLWLFDIEKDPLEKKDLSARYPFVVKELLDKLVAYNSTAVPCRFPPNDPRANPALHGGAWVPWVE